MQTDSCHFFQFYKHDIHTIYIDHWINGIHTRQVGRLLSFNSEAYHETTHISQTLSHDKITSRVLLHTVSLGDIKPLWLSHVTRRISLTNHWRLWGWMEGVKFSFQCHRTARDKRRSQNKDVGNQMGYIKYDLSQHVSGFRDRVKS